MQKQEILKDLIIGCAIGLLSALAGSYLFMTMYMKEEFDTGINALKQAGHLGQLITLGAILNILIFFVLLKLNKEIMARGIILATILLALVTIFV